MFYRQVLLIFLGIGIFIEAEIYKISGDFSFLGAFAIFLIILTMLNCRCPRCGTFLDDSNSKFNHVLPKNYCYRCGRTRRGVWPYQRLLKPEKWDQKVKE